VVDRARQASDANAGEAKPPRKRPPRK
jgi:hypothetical protein